MLVCGIVFLLIALIVILLLRALLLKPNSAQNAKVVLAEDARAKAYGEQLAKLICKETISSRFDRDRTKFLEFHDILQDMFPMLHQTCEKHVFNGSLLFKWPGKSAEKSILFMSHHDVVEANNGEWEHAPFSGDIDEKGRVWGRGSVDTKASLFCMLTAVEEMLSSGFEPEYDIYIASSCTEEWSGEGAPLTVQYLKENHISPALVVDEGGMILEEPVAGVKGTYAMVGIVEKGYGDIKFIARGKGGHASAPGKNTPLVRLGKFMSYIEKHSPFKTKFTPVVTEMFRRMAPNMNFGMRLIFANMWFFKPLLCKLLPSISAAAGAMLKTTMAFTTAKGAEGLNVLPQEAYVTANMRFMKHQDNLESLELVTKLAKKFDLDTEVIYMDAPCPIVDYQGKAFGLVENTIHKVYPEVGVCPYVMTGGTDAKFYSEISENCIRFAPLYIDSQQYASIHAANENLYQGTLPMGVDFYKEIVRNCNQLA